jgi:hypothetical protein
MATALLTLAAVTWGFGPRTCLAQAYGQGSGVTSRTNSHRPAESAVPFGNPAPALPVPLPPLDEPVTLEELSRRLEETQAELARMRFAQAPRIEDPAIETVDEQTGGGGSGTSALREHWNQVQDPAIATVDQQTGGKDGDKKKNWFDRLSIRGYGQFRINEVLREDPNGAPAQYVDDSSVGDDESFFLRRARVVLSGDVSENFYIYIQPEFVVTPPGSQDVTFFSQLRDFFGDIYFDKEKVHRLRVGESKVPYGWESLQSSSNRIPLDRGDAFLSSGRNQRDLGVFYYYTPDFAQELFKFVLDEGLKGSGNYGLFGFGFYNGQGGSIRERNDNISMVARLAVPFQLSSGQVIELDIQGYTGKFVELTTPINPGGIGPPVAPATRDGGYLDQRVGGSLVYYPQPLGFQTEWNVGRGPALNDSQTAIIDRPLYGGYAMMMYRCETKRCGILFPFVRYHHYKGGYKTERNAPNSLVDEWEFGLEWQFTPQMELTTQFTFTDRTNTDAQSTGESYEQFIGTLFRVQFQMNY